MRYEDPTESLFNEILYQYKSDAEKKGIKFILCRETFKELIKGNCYYCGEKPSNSKKRGNRPAYFYNGIDRIDPAEGYVFKNTVSCCMKCNYMKRKFSVVEFKQHIMKLYNHMELFRDNEVR